MWGRLSCGPRPPGESPDIQAQLSGPLYGHTPNQHCSDPVRPQRPTFHAARPWRYPDVQLQVPSVPRRLGVASASTCHGTRCTGCCCFCLFVPETKLLPGRAHVLCVVVSPWFITECQAVVLPFPSSSLLPR